MIVYTVPPSLLLFVSLMYKHLAHIFSDFAYLIIHIYMCKNLPNWRNSFLIFGSVLQIVYMYTCYVFIP